MSASEVSQSIRVSSSSPLVRLKCENINCLPPELLGRIFSYLADPSHLAAVATTCRAWYSVAVNQNIFEKNACEIGFSPFEDSGHKLSEVEVVKLLGVAFINLRRMRTHIWTLLNEVKKEYSPLPPGIATPSISVSAYIRSIPHADDPEYAHREVSKFFATVGLPVDEMGRIALKLPNILVQSKTFAYEGVRPENCIHLIPIISSLKRTSHTLEAPKVINLIALNNLLLTSYLVGITLNESLQNPVGFVSEEILKYKLNRFIAYTHAAISCFFEDQVENKKLLDMNIKASQAKSRKGWRRFF